ncbi:hypothetical protein TGMAS_300270 [Toxoplasma gondii MAS]|uniref:Uncharacterized protein n=1 Tax=Toxoplasma gondii MAS TaxID=943118 RepID=A0A086PVD6_TOXGO|nr:hypothetical protein TGMAS_300270 [Toxoplasma gondii MAS]
MSVKEEKKGGPSEEEVLKEEEEEDQEEIDRQRNLQVTADYTLISRGLVNMNHVELEASRAPEELPAPAVGDWVESKAAHQDAQIFRAKVVERRRCPENIWVFRLRSPDMASTYIEPLKHVRKDSVWSLAREMDLAGGRKTRRFSQQPRRPKSTPSGNSRSQVTGSASPRASSEVSNRQRSEQSSLPAEESPSDPPACPAFVSSPLPSLSSPLPSLPSPLPSLPSPSSLPSCTSAVSPAPSFETSSESGALEGQRRRKTTGDEGEARVRDSPGGGLFVLPGKQAGCARLGVSPSRASFPRRSLPAYHYLEKMLKRTKLALPTRPSAAQFSPLSASPAAAVSCSRRIGSDSDRSRRPSFGENVDISNAQNAERGGNADFLSEASTQGVCWAPAQKKVRLSADGQPQRANAQLLADLLSRSTQQREGQTLCDSQIPVSPEKETLKRIQEAAREIERPAPGKEENERETLAKQVAGEVEVKTRKEVKNAGQKSSLSPVSSPITRGRATLPVSTLVGVGGTEE